MFVSINLVVEWKFELKTEQFVPFSSPLSFPPRMLTFDDVITMLMIFSLENLHNNNFLEVKLYGEFHFVPQCFVFSHVVV